MGLYIGISCLQANWHGAAVSVQTGKVEICGIPVVAPLPKSRLFSDLEQSTSLSQNGLKRLSEREFVLQVFDELEITDVGNHYDEFRHTLQQKPDCRGVAHPYGLSPVVRRAMTAVFDSGPVFAEARSGKNVLPKTRNSNGRPEFCALEAPLAVALNDVVLGDLSTKLGTKTSMIVISPGSLNWEVTAIQVFPALDSVAFSVRSFAEWSTADGIEGIAGLLTDWHIPSGTSIVMTGDLTGTGLSPGITIAGLPTRIVTETDVALGMALYGALCDEQTLTCSMGSFCAIDCHLIAPYAIGICQIGNGDEDPNLFWCPLLEAGAPLSQPPIGIRAEPTDAFLAECVSTTRQPHQWVTGTTDLRWYSHLEVPVVQDDESGNMEISIHSSAGCLNYGWSDPFSKISLQSGPEAHHEGLRI